MTMKLEFFDVNVWIGRPTVDFNNIYVPLKNLLEKMKYLNIKKAIVYHISQRDIHPSIGNEILVKEIQKIPDLFGIWTILPFQTGELKKEEILKDMKENKIIGFNLFPQKHNFLFDKITFQNFLFEIENRKIPLFLDVGSGCGVDFRDVYNILKDFPYLTCILINIGIWNKDRYTFPLLEKFPNVYLESSLLSLQEGNVEEIVKRFGSERIVFGTGFPERYMEASILQLVHAEISEKDKENIAWKNIERIIKEIKYE